MNPRVKETQAQLEAQRLRSALQRQGPGSTVAMVVTVQERRAIWAELTPEERSRVRLITGHSYDEPALASLTVCRAA